MASTSSSSTDQGQQPTLETVAFLRKYGSGKLQRDFELSSKDHKKYPNLILFKYHQTKSDFSQEIVRECRGLIVDAKANWRVVAFPYYKFFNYGEELAAEIDWNTARVYDKVDGSLATLYNYKGEWFVSSTGTPDASGAMPSSLPFADIFWGIWSKLKYKLPTDTSKCYMFEMFARQQRIIVPVQSDMIYLHGVRDLQTLKELDPEPIAAKLGYRLPTSYPLHTLEDVVEASKKLTPDTSEGFVVVDANFNRIKIKSPIYVAMAHLHTKDPSNLNYRGMLTVIRTNESSEFLTYFPQWKALYNNVARTYRAISADISNLWDACKDAGTHDSEAFGLAATKFLRDKRWPHPDVYFNIVKRLQGGLYPTVLDFMQNCDIKILLVLVERFGVKVVHSDTVKINTLVTTPKPKPKGPTSYVALPKHLQQVQGPPKEPVFDSPSTSNESSPSPASTELSAAAHDIESLSIAAPSTAAPSSPQSRLDEISTKSNSKAQSTATAHPAPSKGKQKAKTAAAAPKPSKAEQRRQFEEDEMKAFLSKLEERSKAASNPYDELADAPDDN